jgi:nitrile hydratase beta subunit
VDGIHDLGGMQGFGPVVVEQDEPVFHHGWERRVFGMNFGTLPANIDQFRHTIERMDPAEYLRTSYYEHWLHAIEAELAEHGVFDRPKPENPPIDGPTLLAALQTPRPPPAPPGPSQFGVGDEVRVRRYAPTGHTRCPRYLRGVPGHIVAVRGTFTLPDASARGENRQEPLYCAAFSASDIWGASDHIVHADLWESYLE